MSMNWSWGQKDDQKVIACVGKASEEALLVGNNYLASEILMGASNFFALRNRADRVGGNSDLVRSWLWGIHNQIYEGTAIGNDHSLDRMGNDYLSVVKCFRLLNLFFRLNNLDAPETLTGQSLNLIIPELYDDEIS